MTDVSELTVEQAFEEYENVKMRMKLDAKRVEELQEIILPHVPADVELQGRYGYFVIQPRQTWKYSPETAQMKKDLKKAEADEQARGIAKATSSPVLYYRKGKPGDETEEE